MTDWANRLSISRPFKQAALFLPEKSIKIQEKFSQSRSSKEKFPLSRTGVPAPP